MSAEAKTWRERIVEARARGKYTEDDERAYMNRTTCLAAEVAGRYGVTFDKDRWYPTRGYADCASVPGWEDLWRLGDEATVTNPYPRPVEDERVLDRIEDRALELKRASGASRPEGARP